MFHDGPGWNAPHYVSSDDEAVDGRSDHERQDDERRADQDGERQVGERQDGECQKRNQDDDVVVIDAPPAKVRMPHFARVGPDFTRRGMEKLQLGILQRQKKRWEEMNEEERQAVRKKKKGACSAASLR